MCCTAGVGGRWGNKAQAGKGSCSKMVGGMVGWLHAMPMVWHWAGTRINVQELHKVPHRCPTCPPHTNAGWGNNFVRRSHHAESVGR